MTIQRCSAALFVASLSSLLVHTVPSAAQSTKSQVPAGDKIKRALSAGPPSATSDATVAEFDSDGKLKILRQGTNDFTCRPDGPAEIGMPAMCADNGIATSQITKRGRLPPSPASNICWREPRSEVTLIRSTKQARPFPLGRIV